ncbi:YaaR family protein [Neobacillus novalis]|uniref:YaaR family protein n=1 Tax=Neobacillus novalis TaxID=220687 RepID=A0AA95MY82_9BACI|nr:YaaR family protein [Neobacillus novalis]WHY88383.1 YaaR family protein [Neobacillus novalis]
MKIQPNHGVNQERFFSTREKGKETLSFHHILQEKQTTLSEARLQTIFDELEQHGSSLSRSRSLKDLIAYKQTIQSFLKEVAQNGVAIEEHKGSYPNGREKRLKMIKQVDHQLLGLSDLVLDKQAPSIDLLQKMGEIKGLLVNLYL